MVKTNYSVHGKPRYRIRETIGKRVNEKGIIVPIRKSFIGKTRKEAEEKRKAYIEKRATGIDGSNLYFGIVAENWLYDFMLNDPSLQDRTKQTYMERWNGYVKDSALYSMPIEEITATTLQSFYNSCGAADSSLETIDKVMKRFYRYLELEGIAKDITRLTVVPKRSRGLDSRGRDPLVWEDDEIEKIFGNFDKVGSRFRHKFLVILAYYTGCRINELLALKYDDFKDGMLRINKQVIRRAKFVRGKETQYEMGLDTLKTASSYRKLPLNETVLSALEEHKAWQKEDMEANNYETDYLFTTNTGKFYDRHNVEHALDNYYDKIGVPHKGMHTYRRTFCTNLCRAGVPIQVASKLMGHANITDTAKYYVNIPEEEKLEAVKMLESWTQNKVSS